MAENLIMLLKVIGKTIAVILICYVVFLIFANMSRVDSEYKESYVLNNTEARRELISVIKKSGIPYELRGDHRDEVWFRSEDSREVLELISELNRIENSRSETFSYFDSKFTDILEDELIKQGIRHETSIRKGHKALTLYSSDSSKWSEIKNKVDNMAADSAYQSSIQSKDRENMQVSTFESDLTQSMQYTESDVKNIVVTKYPQILDEARMVDPAVAKITSGIEGFAKAGEEVWHIRIIDNNGGIKALFFVHPQSGKLFELQSPTE